MDELKRVIINGEEYSISGDSCFVRYSAYDDGTDFTEEWSEGQFYIGVSTAQEAPTDKSDYVWSRIGKDGEDYVLTDEDISNIAEEAVALIEIDEDISIPQIGKNGEYGEKDFEGLKIGKVYNAVNGKDIPSLSCLLAVYFEDEQEWFVVTGFENNADPFTFKVLGVKNSIVSYEYNGELRNRDLSDHTRQHQNKIDKIMLQAWSGDLYLTVNIKGEKGDKGDKGDPYTLTEADKTDIATEALNLMEQAEDYNYGG